jgi:hypothetical protein
MRLHWFPWKFLIQRAAKAYGLMDPLTLMARLRKFSQPSDVQEPIELLRAGIVFHARGLVNTRVVQNNLDWVWPYWIERQYNPKDVSFIPRGFSFSHINMTHRNWTALGRPDLALYPIVDPRGMLTPFYDGWSLDFWLIPENGAPLLPSRLPSVQQTLRLVPEPTVETIARDADRQLQIAVRVPSDRYLPAVAVDIAWRLPEAGHLAVSLRPYNPEGIQFVETVERLPDGGGLLVNGAGEVQWEDPPERVVFANYRSGDVLHQLDAAQSREGIACPEGVATAAALFSAGDDGSGRLKLTVPLAPDLARQALPPLKGPTSWTERLAPAARLRIPDERLQHLYDAALGTLVLLSAGDVVPGPYTYRRFWFRDACLMLHAMLAAGLTARCRRRMDGFFRHQERSGYFRSQEGEWDSNGQVLWLLERFQRATRLDFPTAWMKGVLQGAEWIRRKRRANDPHGPYAGLLPAGFSAEHFGPNDYYYWDDFWGAAGLRAAARLAGRLGSERAHRRFQEEADRFEAAIFASIAAIPPRRSRGGIPAAPGRRMDSAAIGSLVADYPLQLLQPGDMRTINTADFLMAHCLYEGAFFQDMIHSGQNAYMTLALAQTLLRAGDARHEDLIKAVARLASPTGQWPEAIHPATGGGCMGDGQHGWAAAEWVLALRALFIREEADHLIVGSGLFAEWLAGDAELSFGPSPTAWGPVAVRITVVAADVCRVAVDGQWHDTPPDIVVALPGFRRQTVQELDGPLEVRR